MFKKHYRLISLLFLLAVAIGWIVFLDMNRPEPPEPDKTAEQVLTDARDRLQEKKKTEPVVTEAPEPTGVPVISPDNTDSEPVTEPTDGPAPTEAPSYTKFDYVVANVNESMNVRSGAGSDKSIVGKLPANGYAKIIERDTEWFKIKSGGITGYVSTQYILMDNDAIDKMRSLDALKIQITGSEVNVRAEDNTNCDILEKATTGKIYDYYPEYSTSGFYAIKLNDRIAYVSTEYSQVFIKLKTAQ